MVEVLDVKCGGGVLFEERRRLRPRTSSSWTGGLRVLMDGEVWRCGGELVVGGKVSAIFGVAMGICVVPVDFGRCSTVVRCLATS